MRRASVKKLARVQDLDHFVDWTQFCEALEASDALTPAKLKTS
jgi:hypothetical protein